MHCILVVNITVGEHFFSLNSIHRLHPPVYTAISPNVYTYTYKCISDTIPIIIL